MIQQEEPSFNSVFSPSLMFEYINTYTNNKSVTYSEFKGFTKININEYMLVLNYTNNYDKKSGSFDVSIDYIDVEHFKLFLLKKRFEQYFI